MSGWPCVTQRVSPRFLRGVFTLIVVLVAAVWLMPVSASAQSASDSDTLSATQADTSFGISGFERSNKGSARLVDGQDVGYRVPVAHGATLTVVITPTAVLVHMDTNAAEQSGWTGSKQDEQALRSMVETLDAKASMGGQRIDSLAVPWVFVESSEYVQEPYRYVFSGESSLPDNMVVTLAGAPQDDQGSEAARRAGVDLSAGVLWCDSAQIVSASSVEAPLSLSPLEQVEQFLSQIDYRPLAVSLKTGAAALAVSLVLGLLGAWATAGGTSRLKGLLDSVFTIPMVLPPTVCGFLLLMTFGQASFLGRWFIQHGISLVFSWPAAVISAVVVSFPLVYRTARGAFEGLDTHMLDAARTLGWSEWRIFTQIMVPLCWPGIASGAVLAFARAMGEFGCTLFFAGNYAGVTQTIPIAMYFEWMGGNTQVALFWVVVVIVFSLVVLVCINGFTARTQRFRNAGHSAAATHIDTTHSDEVGSGDDIRIDREALVRLMDQSAPSAQE